MLLVIFQFLVRSVPNFDNISPSSSVVAETGASFKSVKIGCPFAPKALWAIPLMAYYA